MRRRIEAGLMARVQALLNARQALPRAGIENRPRLQTTENGDVTDLMIYDEISWFGICAQDVVDALAGVKGDLHVRINSPGGDVFDGVAIYNALADHDGNVMVTVDGLAASAASFIAMAGDTIRMNRGTQMMIHDASGLCIGNAAEMSEMAGLLNKVSDTIAGIYADRTGVDAADWRERMLAETWYNADEAVTAGLATEMAPSKRRGQPEPDGDEPQDKATVKTWDLTVFQYAGRAKAPAPLVDTASSVHHTATEDSAWDGPAAVAAMPAEAATLKYCHAWRDADGDPEAKGSYKFPHHRKEGGPANVAACRNGLARLSGADIPDGDRSGVEAHLNAHLSDGGGDTEGHTTGRPAATDTGPEPPAVDPWAEATAHLTTEDDEFERLKEALL